MRRMVSWIALGFMAATVAGCGPHVSQEELGTVINTNQIPGITEPYELPQAGTPSSGDGQGEQPGSDSHAGHDH